MLKVDVLDPTHKLSAYKWCYNKAYAWSNDYSIGSYIADAREVIAKLNYPESLDFGSKDGGFNMLNAPNELYKTPNQFWIEYNQLF